VKSDTFGADIRVFLEMGNALDKHPAGGSLAPPAKWRQKCCLVHWREDWQIRSLRCRVAYLAQARRRHCRDCGKLGRVVHAGRRVPPSGGGKRISSLYSSIVPRSS
jgi:hypothetical protein